MSFGEQRWHTGGERRTATFIVAELFVTNVPTICRFVMVVVVAMSSAACARHEPAVGYGGKTSPATR